jgi:hypothetical protein
MGRAYGNIGNAYSAMGYYEQVPIIFFWISFLLCLIWGSQSGDYEEFYFLKFNTM